MADNTALNPGAGGDTIRDLARQGGTVKTEVTQLDAGGGALNAESLVSATNPLPVIALLQALLDPDGALIVNPYAPSADTPTASLQRDLIDAVYGKPGAPGPALNFPVGTSSTPIFQLPNLGRRGLVLTNVSTGGQRIALSLNGAPAVLDAGMVLWPQNWWWMDRYSFTTGPIFAIASAAGGALAGQEFS